MLFMIILAFLNGLAVSAGRVVEARLAKARGAIAASSVSHLVAFAALLSLALLVDGSGHIAILGELPRSSYLAGVASAAFVALSSWALPRVGALRGILLLVAGQMLFGALVDAASGRIKSLPMEILGVVLILAGVNILHYAGRRP